MPRKARTYEKHIPQPDPKFGSVKYAKFINYLMQRGKKTVAQKIFYDAMEIVGAKIKQAKSADLSPSAKGGGTLPSSAPTVPSGSGESNKEKAVDNRQVFDIALKNASPIMEVKGRRIGGSNYQVPMEVMEPRRTTLGMKWLIAGALAKKGIRMAEKLAGEILDAYNKTGAAVKKREDVHRMAEANKAFAHFARFNRNRR